MLSQRASIAAGQSEGRDFFFPEYVADGPPQVAGNARGIDGARFATFTGRMRYKALSLAWSLHHHDKQLPTGQFDTLFGDGRTSQADTRGFAEARLEVPVGGWMTSLTRVHGNLYAYRGDFARSPFDEGLEDAKARDRRRMSRGEEAFDLVARHLCHDLHHWGDVLVGGEHRQVRR